MNKVFLAGRVGQQPELRVSPGGIAILKISVATDSNVKNKDGQWEKRTEWHRVTVFNKRAEGLAKILDKGTPVAVEGSLRTSKYEKDGVASYSTEVIADDVKPFGGKKSDGKASSTEPQEDFGDGFGDGGDGSIPF